MDPRLQQAAETGSIDALYVLIKENPYILENFDAVPFIDTPLHVAAASGNLAFAVEMLNLKPSFAKKLNTSGYSPLHLAVENDQEYFVTWMLRHDAGLARFKGRNNITPFLLLVERGNTDLVAKCLDNSPDCIQDMSVNSHNALHLAVMNNRFEVLQVLIGWLQKNDKQDALSIEIDALNEVDFNLNTPLHLATINDNHEAARLLLECRKVARNMVNSDGLTFLDIFRNKGQTAGGNLDIKQVPRNTLCKKAASLRKSKTRSDILKSPHTFWTFFFTLSRRARSQYSGEDRGAFLIICVCFLCTIDGCNLTTPSIVSLCDLRLLPAFCSLYLFDISPSQGRS